MLMFNAFQLTILFAFWPFIVEFFKTSNFTCSGLAYWVSIVAYCIHFMFNMICTFKGLRDFEK